MGFRPILSKKRRKNSPTAAALARKRSLRRTLLLENLEARQMMAVGPQLQAIIPNEGPNLFLNQPLHASPTELKLVFTEGQAINPTTLGAIYVLRAGGDATWGNGNDVLVTPFDVANPGHIGLGDRPNEVVIRFASPLPDDHYTLTIVGNGPAPLRNTTGDAYNNTFTTTTGFEIELGTRIVGVVPQPITRTGNQLSQARDVIEVYFDKNDPIDPGSAQNPAFYQLLATNNTADSGDDQLFQPSSVIYDPTAGKAILSFGVDLASLGGVGAYRLRVGDSDAPPHAGSPETPLLITPASDNDSQYLTANQLGALSGTSQVISAAIDPQAYGLTLPGGNDEPGHRNIPAENHLLGVADNIDGISTVFYNFQNVIGVDLQGNTLFNVITPTQKQRVREVFEFYSQYLGVQFVESDNQGWLIAAGDLHAIDPSVNSQPGGVLGVAGGGKVVIDASEDFGNSAFGGLFFQVAMHEIGHLIGIGHSTELPDLTVNSGTVPGQFGNTGELVFPGDQDIVHGQHLYRPESKDIDLYAFTLNEPGKLSAEITAERLADSSLLDAVITLFDESFSLRVPGGADSPAFLDKAQFGIYDGVNGPVGFELHMIGSTAPTPGLVPIAFNLGDSAEVMAQRIADTINHVRTMPGAAFQAKAVVSGDRVKVTNIIGIFALPTRLEVLANYREVIARNDDYFSEDSFLNMDLAPGKYYIGVTSKGNTSYDPTIPDSGFGGTSQGEYQLRLNFSPKPTNTMVDTTGTPLDGDSDGRAGGEFNFWFTVADQANTIVVDKAAPAGGDGSINAPFNNVPQALFGTFFLSGSEKVVRLVGNGGADGNLSTVADAIPYTIGKESPLDPFSPALADGETLEVPHGVTVMIDAGAVLKMRNSAIAVGSASQNIDRSLGALQVLGTPDNKVYFTSLKDESIGADQTVGPTIASPGDWGGLVFRNDWDDRFVDHPDPNLRREVRENDGIFLNYVNQADIRYGGGNGKVDQVTEKFTSLHMVRARPTITNNIIVGGADAAISADPNSFEETHFFNNDSGTEYTADYDRVGPEIHFNRLSTQLVGRPGGIEGASSGGPIVITTALPHGLSTGARVRISGVLGNTAANGDFVITVTGANSFSLNGSFGNGIYTPSATDTWQKLEVLDNSINGLFVRINIQAGELIDTLDVSARFDDTDIVHVISQALIIAGEKTEEILPTKFERGTGGPRLNPVTGLLDARLDARLSIDPGTIVKLDGARIEAQISTQFIAEGTAEQQIVFTSINDDRYGRGGTFDSNADEKITTPAIGDWGGLFFDRLSIGSLDHVLVTYAGGQSTIEGGRGAFFNAIEIHQADVRIANSMLRENEGIAASGVDATRHDRGTNEAATIFVRGAQPILVNNIIRDNAGDAISINANALNSRHVSDIGRSVGSIDVIPLEHANQGPLVRDNRMRNNNTNGMVVRGAVLTTEGVWDDTDIVHVLLDEVEVPNHHTFGGLRLKSNPEESLVIKLQGGSAGFTAGGTKLDISDRIGGTLQVVGMPEFPVVMTAITDDSAAAGVDIDGAPAGDTNEGFRAIGATSGQTNASYTGLDIKRPPADPNAFTTPVSKWGDPRFGTGAVVTWAFMPAGVSDPSNLDGGWTNTPLSSFMPAGFDNEIRRAFAAWSAVANITFVEIVDTGEPFGSPGAADIRVGGHLIDGPFGVLAHGFLPANNPAAPFDGDLHFDSGDLWKIGFGGNPNAVDIFQVAAHEIGHTIGLGHTTASGSLMEPLYTETFAGPQADDIAGAVFLYGQPAIGTAGAWRSVRLEKFANDRNVEVVLESEDSTTGLDVNNVASKAQFIGNLAIGEKHSDENLRLGFEVHGFVSLNNTTDVDVFSFTAQTNTEVWIDIDRTTHALDTVVELIDASGRVLARSDNSVNELAAGMLPTIPGGTNLGRLLQRDAFNGDDLYTTNPRDAGMRVLLPGAVGQRNTYFVRVRSRGDNIEATNTGLTRGGYQMQLRLREADEAPGTTVRNSDIRFAVNGIEALGLPAHSPLLGDAAETLAPNDTAATAQDLGNLLSNDRGSISVAGTLSNSADVDFFRITVDYDLIQSLTGIRSWAAMFDIDYADGLGRPDTVISVFDDAGNLLLVGRDSNIAEDQPGPTEGADTDDLNRGSFGKLDPYIGTVQLPEQGVNAAGQNAPRTYIVAVSSNAQLPTVLNASFTGSAANPLIRLEPITSVRRVVEDHIGFTGGATASSGGAAFSGSTVAELNLHANSFQLGDVTMFVNSTLELYTVDGFTGAGETNVTFQNGANNRLPATTPAGAGFSDIAMRNDGRLFAFTHGNNNANSGNFVEISTGNGTQISRGDDGIATFGVNAMGQPAASDVGVQFEALDFYEPNGRFNRELFAVGFAPAAPEHARRDNLLFELDPDTGVVLPDMVNTNPAQIPPADPLPRATLDVGVNGVKLTVVAGNQIDDGDTFQINEGFGPQTLEMDSGITLLVNSPGAAIPDGTSFSVSDGATTVNYVLQRAGAPVPTGVVVISINDTMTASAVASAIASALTAGQITTQPGQPLLPNPHAGNLRATHLAAFGQGTRIHIEDLNISTLYGAASGSAHVSVLGAAGVQTPGAFRIAFTPMDSASMVAQRIEQALLTGGPFSTITAISVGNMVNLQVSPQSPVPTVTIPASTPFTQAALPGGFGGSITGIEFVGNSLFAVTNTGTFLEYDRLSIAGNVSFNPLISPIFSTNISQIPFTGLTLAPQNIDVDHNGIPDYENTFIATAADGRLYAINTLGQLQPIFVDGATSVSLGGPGFGARGVAFSPLDFNLWHVTNQRQFDDGHDITTSFDNSRFNGTANPRTHIEGGTSFYFGLEDPNVNTTISNQPGADNFRTNTNFNYNTYNLPGGAHGSLTTDSFSLEGYSPTDKPTLYFDYFLETQGADVVQFSNGMRDSLRVFVSNDGVNWSQLATNNSTLSAPAPGSIRNAELPDHITSSGGAYRGDLEKQRVQELFDNTGVWRQARIDLGDFAGMSTLRLRFDFSTAGAMNPSSFGVAGSVTLSGAAGSDLRDGQQFTIGHSSFGPPPITFEFDSGFTLVMPNSAGSKIVEGNTFTINDGANPSVTYEFTRDGVVAGGNTPILIDNGDSAEDVARKVQAVLLASPPGIATSVLNGNRVNLQGAVGVTVTFGSLVTIDGAPGVAPGNIQVLIDEGMTLDEVVGRMAKAIDAAFAAQAGNVDDPNVQTTAQIEKGALRLYGKTIFSGGPLTFSSTLIGDNQGNFTSPQRGQNNDFEGAYIDNIVVGFAERGEMVTGHRPSGQPAVGNTTFFPTPIDPTPTGLENLSGNYQLEIRRGTEYATVFDDVTGEVFLSRSIDTNDRLTDEFTLRLPAGIALRDGQTVTINDGLTKVVFEFTSDAIFTPGNVPVSFTMLHSAATVASNLATAINNHATLTTLAATTPTSNRIDLSGAAFVDITFGGIVTTGDLATENNDTLVEAVPSGLSSATPGRFTAAGLIGDNPDLLVQPSLDVDLISFQLNAGETIKIDIDAQEFGSPLDAIVIVFDSNGNFVAFNDDDPSGLNGPSLDSYLEFTALVSGTYYVGVSGFSNFGYDPTIEGSGGLGPNQSFSVGEYSIELTIGNNLISVEQYEGVGDDNQFREQGQIILQSNKISRFSQNGIIVDADLRDVPGQLPHQGSVRNLPQNNTARLVSGVTIINNVIHDIGQAGITISGESDTTGQVPLGAVPFVRVINNTIWGGASRPGVGIRVNESASPTLLNNIVADVSTGITVDASSQAAGTVISATLYRNAPTSSANTGAINNGLGSFPITLTNAEPLFENEIAGVFSLRQGSRAIDSSIDSVQDRPELITVKTPLGIGPSPILAPTHDLMGVLRKDDPSQDPLGQGGNVFKDRGALERVNVPRISIAGSSVVEGNQGTALLVFTVTLDQAVNDLVTVDFATSNQNAAGGVDYVNTSGKLTFFPGSHTVQTITVPVIGDTLDENDETFLITLTNETNSLILNGQATGTIIDDDLAPTISINNASVIEGNGGLPTPMVFTVMLSGPSGRDLTINFATSDVSATGGIDYQATNGILTFSPGQTSRTVTVNVFGDLIAETDETFNVNLTAPVNVQLPAGTVGVGTIIEDEPKFAIADATLVEGNSGTQNMIFNVSLLPAVGTPVSVLFNTLDGTATAGSDYQATSGTLSFAPNETMKTITVQVIGDTNVEPDEAFNLVLSNATGAGLGDNVAAGTIVNDDQGGGGPGGGGTSLLVAGADAGVGPHVRVFDANSLQEKFSLLPYNIGFRGGVRVATADMNGDGVDDIITAPGVGGGPHIRMFDGVTGAPLNSPLANFFAFEGTFTGGVHIAAGDVNGDGRADLIASTGTTGALVGEAASARVRVFNGVTGGLIRQFSFNSSSVFSRGMHVAAGDINGDNRDEVILGAAPGNASRVQAYDALSGGLMRDFLAYGAFGGGVFVAAGDLNGDNRDEIITGAGAGGGPHVLAFDGATNAVVHSFYAYNAGVTAGVRVASTDVNLDGVSDIVTAPGAGGGPHVRGFHGVTGAPISDLFAFVPTFTGGVFVAGNGGGSPLMASGLASGDAGSLLTDDQLQPIVQEAIARWAGANISAEQLGRMRNTSVRISDLPAGYLGLARSEGIFIDADAAGYGWYVDATPADDAEYASPSGAAAKRMDLLTAVMHELGHAAGLDHDDHADEVMAETLVPGLRRSPTETHIDDVFGSDDEWLY